MNTTDYSEMVESNAVSCGTARVIHARHASCVPSIERSGPVYTLLIDPEPLISS
jgi:hypothetical protein